MQKQQTMVLSILLILFYVITPAILIWLCNTYKIFKKTGAVLIAYAFGLVIGNTGILQHVPGYQTIQQTITNATIPLALPLLLFSMQFKSWTKMARMSVLSLLTGLVAVIIAVTTGYLLFNNSITEAWKVSGMLIGLYTGGTPNLASIQVALNADASTYLLINTVDIAISALFLFVLMSFGKTLMRRFLPSKNTLIQNTPVNSQNNNEFDFTFTNSALKQTFIAMGLSLIISAISAGASFLITGSLSMLVLILSITTLGIGGSFIKKINNLQNTFQSGMYLILVFCLVVASMANVKQLSGMATSLLLYISYVIFVALFLHVILAKIFKINADTLIITSTALICSPPFVPVVAGALKNRNIIFTGLTVGIIGYAVGNYLGVFIAYLLNSV